MAPVAYRDATMRDLALSDNNLRIPQHPLNLRITHPPRLSDFGRDAQPWWVFFCVDFLPTRVWSRATLLHGHDGHSAFSAQDREILAVRTYRKPALTFDQQLDRLIERGLIVRDREHSLDVLSRISYYRLTAYAYVFRQAGGDPFVAGTTFEQVIELYEFDRHLRLLITDALERVEVAVRTDITYQLGCEYGAFGHCVAAWFRHDFKHRKWLEHAESEANRSSDTFIDHYKKQYAGFPSLPIWMATEVLSLGSLSHLYEGMLHHDQKVIADRYTVEPKVMVSWLRSLTYVRNVCAHHARLWNRHLSVAPSLPSRDANWSPPLTPTNQRIFAVLLILRRMMDRHHDGVHWKQRVENLLEPVALDGRQQAAMGMPTDWRTHPLWTLT